MNTCAPPKPFSWKIYKNGNRRIWWNPHIRMWTQQIVDEEENQVGECEYDRDREVAFRFLNDTQVFGQKKSYSPFEDSQKYHESFA